MTRITPPLIVEAGRRPSCARHGLSRKFRRLVAAPDLADAVHCALAAVLPDVRGGDARVPIALAAPSYCGYAFDQYISCCEHSTRLLRPSDSVALEPAGLLLGFVQETGWRGPCQIVVTPEAAGQQAGTWATALVESGRVESAVVCEAFIEQGVGAFALVARIWGDDQRVLREVYQEGPGDSPSKSNLIDNSQLLGWYREWEKRN